MYHKLHKVQDWTSVFQVKMISNVSVGSLILTEIDPSVEWDWDNEYQLVYPELRTYDVGICNNSHKITLLSVMTFIGQYCSLCNDTKNFVACKGTSWETFHELKFQLH